MRLFGWLRSVFTIRHKALQLYRHGRKRARNKDFERAIAKFTEAIDMVAVPIDVKAMVLYHRALAYVAIGSNEKGINDLNSVVAMDGAMAVINIKTMARQMMARIKLSSPRGIINVGRK